VMCCNLFYFIFFKFLWFPTS